MNKTTALKLFVKFCKTVFVFGGYCLGLTIAHEFTSNPFIALLVTYLGGFLFQLLGDELERPVIEYTDRERTLL